MTRTIYFLSTVDPSDKTNGKGIVVSGIESYFVTRYGRHDFRMIMANKRSSCFDGFAMPGLFKVFFNILLYALILRRKSIQECFYWDSRNVKFIKKVFEENNVDLFLFDTIRTAQYVSYLPHLFQKKCQVYLDDLFSRRYQRMIGLIKCVDFNPLGNFSKYVPSLFGDFLLRNKWLISIVLRIEEKLVRKSEINIALLAERVMLINRQEVNLLQADSGSRSIYELPPLLTCLQFGRREFVGEKMILFLGSLKFSHNKTGINAFLMNAFSEIIEQDPSVCLHIIGGGVDEDTLSLIRGFPEGSIAVHGRVDSLTPYLSRAAMLVAPLVMGSGVKIKCIDALSHALPIVATDIGAEGIPIFEYGAGIIANDWGEFGRSCIGLLDPVVNERYSSCALRLFNDKYSRRAVEQTYDKVFGIS